ncbi:hypothetical protein [Immundisolibacter sp.]
MAINQFNDLPLFDGLTGGYLYIHGLLQTLYMQQDSVNHLSQSLFIKKINYKKNYPEIYSVRELRNDVTGHPTNNYGKYFCVISQTTISNLGFTYCRYHPNGNNQFIHIEIKSLLNKQRELVSKILNKIIGDLKMEDKEHKKKFSEDKLVSIFPNSLNYQIEKLFEGAYSKNTNKYPMTKISLDLIQSLMNDLTKAIDDRFESLNAVSSVKGLIMKINFINKHLFELINSQKYSGNLDTEVYLDSLKRSLSDLKGMCQEIDDDFKED